MVAVAIADPSTITEVEATEFFEFTGRASAVLWNTQLTINPDSEHLSVLAERLRIPAERPLIAPGVEYAGVLSRLLTRSHRLAQEMVEGHSTDLRRAPTQSLYAAALNRSLRPEA